LETLSGSELSWIKALLTSQNDRSGFCYIDNPLRRALAPRRGQKVVIGMNNGSPTSSDPSMVHGVAWHPKPDFKAVEISTLNLEAYRRHISRTGRIYPCPCTAAQVRAVRGRLPIQEVAVVVRRIKEFY